MPWDLPTCSPTNRSPDFVSMHEAGHTRSKLMLKQGANAKIISGQLGIQAW